MPAFSTRQRSPSQILQSIRRHPFAFFGLPFLSLIVVSSFALQHFTRTRYDLHGQKVQAMSKEEELKMDKGRKRVDIREEYYVGLHRSRGLMGAIKQSVGEWVGRAGWAARCGGGQWRRRGIGASDD